LGFGPALLGSVGIVDAPAFVRTSRGPPEESSGSRTARRRWTGGIMSNRSQLLFTILALTSLTACKGEDSGAKRATPTDSAASTGSAATTATAAAAAAGKCGALGCTGEGTFNEMCDCKGKGVKPPFEVKYTGKYSSSFKAPEFEITNTSDKDIHWGSAAIYYYDKSGKQLEAKIGERVLKASRINGSNFSFAPKEKKTLHLGFKQENEPQGIDSMEVVIDGWCFGTNDDKASHLCVETERAPDERPRSQ
jgi:hypothetical protein